MTYQWGNLSVDTDGAARSRARQAARVERKKKKKYVCSICGRKCKSRVSLTKHHTSKHLDVVSPKLAKAVRISQRRRVAQRPKAEVEWDVAQQFYKTPEWRRARYGVIVAAGGRCQACGARPHGDVYLNVDHIKPLRWNWALRLDPGNLQCLCSVCNEGKGNWDQTDWRPSVFDSL